MKAKEKYKREEGGRVGDQWLVSTDFLGSHIFSRMPNKHGITKKLMSSLEDGPLYISQG
jgi:hypothetical protein